MARNKDKDTPADRAERSEATDRAAQEQGFRGRLEGMVPEVVKRAMLSGLGALFVTEETIRGAVSDMRLPKEAVGYMLQ